MKKTYRIEVEFDTESPDYDGSGDPERDLELFSMAIGEDFIRERVDAWEDVTEESK